MKQGSPSLQFARLGYSVRRYFIDEFHLRQVTAFPQASRVLDLGGYKHQKRGRFNLQAYPFWTVTANITGERGADVLADAGFLPFADGCLEAVICAELLEHVPEPHRVLQECYRILRANGQLVVSVPFLYRIHADPGDYGRYTDQYWQAALGAAGFREVHIEKHGLFYTVFADLVKQYLNYTVRRPFRQLAGWPAGWLQSWALRRESKAGVRNDPFLSSFTTGFGIVAVK